MIVRPGSWCDVAVLPDGRFAHVVTNGNSVTTYIDGIASPAIVAPEALLFCRAAMWNSQIVSVHQGNGSGSAYLLRNRTYENLGATFGVQPVAIDGTHVYIVRSNQSYDRIALDTGEVEHLPHGAPGSSQGISDVEPDGTIRWADTSRVARLDGVTLTYPNRRGAVTVGQADPPQVAGVSDFDDAFTAIAGDGYEPHVAQSRQLYAIVARTPQGAAYVEVPPYPAFVAAPVPAPPSSEPRNPTPPKPAPQIPESAPVNYALPSSVKSIRDRYVAQYPVPQGPSPADDAFENVCRAWVYKLAQTVAALTGDDSWGTKNAGGGRPQSKDSLAHQDGGRLINFDLLSGVGTGRPTLVSDPSGEDITGQTFLPVQPVNWLSGTGAPNPGPIVPNPGTPAPTVDLAPLLAEIAALKIRVGALEEDAHRVSVDLSTAVDQLIGLKQKPAPRYRVVGGTGRTFGHSHTVNVTLEPAE